MQTAEHVDMYARNDRYLYGCTSPAVLILRHNSKDMPQESASASTSSPRYVQIGQGLAQLIEGKAFRSGQRLPSVRELAQLHGVSLSTAVQALRWLEERHLVTAKPKSGYFVAPRLRPLALPETSQPPLQSFKVRRPSRNDALALSADNPHQISFGGTCPKDAKLFDESRVRTALSRATRQNRFSLVEYNTDELGVLALRQAIAQRSLHLGCHFIANQLVITNSCSQSFSLCLQAVTQPGDVVALESPTYFGFLDLIETLGLRALEIPTHPRHGLSLPALQLALDTQPVKAVLAVPTLSNPLGAVMPHAAKQQLVRMLAQRRIPLIEDLVFNDLLASDERRKAAKSFDQEGWVLACGSYSKTVTPGIRLGWVQGGRWHDRIVHLKHVHGITTPQVVELALADLLTQVGYESRLRRLSETLRLRLAHARRLVGQHFPKGTRVSAPPTGYTLWVELPEGINSQDLFERCRTEGIVFGPGQLFSATDRFRHCLRLSFSQPWTHEVREALVRVGGLAHTD